MEVMTRPQSGLFPHPKQIKLSCSCPDWAEMCKHVAASLYGVGARLDEKPELLFALRQVDHADLVSRIDMTKATKGKAVSDGQMMGDENLEAIFGIDLGADKKTPVRKKIPRKISKKTSQWHKKKK